MAVKESKAFREILQRGQLVMKSVVDAIWCLLNTGEYCALCVCQQTRVLELDKQEPVAVTHRTVGIWQNTGVVSVPSFGFGLTLWLPTVLVQLLARCLK